MVSPPQAEQYRAAVVTQPNYLEATVKLGAQHLRQGRHADAAQMFNRAVELNDRLMTAFVGLGVAQHLCGREREAQATFDLAASLEPNSTLLFAETARLQLKSEQTRSRPPLSTRSWISRVTLPYLDLCDELLPVVKPAPRAGRRAEKPKGQRYRVRLRLMGSSRSGCFDVDSVSEASAAAAALERAAESTPGQTWEVLDVSLVSLISLARSA